LRLRIERWIEDDGTTKEQIGALKCVLFWMDYLDEQMGEK
jgi:hypothetical protein